MGLKMPVIPVDFANVSSQAEWYTVVTKFNYEQKFVKDLYAGLRNIGLEENILEVVIPNKEHHQLIVDSKGKEKDKVTIEKVMPLYVFVKAVMTEKVFYYLRNTAGCANIMAAGGSLLTMTEDEIIKIKNQCGIKDKEETEENLED
jgi:transcription antitermination factor NusG